MKLFFAKLGLVTKIETFYKFKEFKDLVENQTSRHIHAIRYDNRGEFESNSFNKFCNDAGRCRQLTVPYKPQHIGVADRNNITICEDAKTMLHDQYLSNYLWA